MLGNVKQVTRLANCQALSIPKMGFTINLQQKREVKTYRYKTAYGEPGLITEDEYQDAKESSSGDELSYKKIRFASVSEYVSPLFDRDVMNFTNQVMRDGRKQLAMKLVNETFYNIKCRQYVKMRKQLAKQQSSEDTGDKKEQPLNSIGGTEEEKPELNPVTIFKVALDNCKPLVVTRKIKRGGATYDVPFPLEERERILHVYKWILDTVKERPKPRTKHFPEVMADELLDAYNMKGKVVKKRDDIHKLADSNKAFAHYRWS